MLIAFLFVRDLGRSEAFFATGLGLPVVRRQPDCVIVDTAGGFLGLCERPDDVSPEGIIITLVVDDPESLHASALEAGATEIHPPRHSDRYRILHSKVHSPDGHIVEFQRFDEPL